MQDQQGYSDGFLQSLLSSSASAKRFFAEPEHLKTLLGWRAEYRWQLASLLRRGGLRVSISGPELEQDKDQGQERTLTERVCADSEFDRYEQSWGRDFNILLTLRCPLECAHCSVRSSPHRKEQLHESHLDHLLQMMKDFKTIRPRVRFVLTGGEPFLHREAINRILEAAELADSTIGVETSGYWASTLEKARSFVAKYQRITSYLISADVYHLPFLSVQGPINAWIAITEAGHEAKIRLVLHPEKTEEERSLIAQLKSFIPESDLVQEVISPVGRGLEVLGESWFRRTDYVPSVPCPSEGPLVRETGRIDPCCSAVTTLDNHPLVLGHLAQDSARDVFDHYQSHVLLHCIRLWGIPAIIWLLRGSSVSDQLPKQFVRNDTCFACYEVFRNPELSAVLQELAAEFRLRFEVAIGRAIFLDEDESLEQLCNEVG